MISNTSNMLGEVYRPICNFMQFLVVPCEKWPRHRCSFCICLRHSHVTHVQEKELSRQDRSKRKSSGWNYTKLEQAVHEVDFWIVIQYTHLQNMLKFHPLPSTYSPRQIPSYVECWTRSFTWGFLAQDAQDHTLYSQMAEPAELYLHSLHVAGHWFCGESHHQDGDPPILGYSVDTCMHTYIYIYIRISDR